ncbi:cytochrome P450 [Lentithecium fluviatile CBS 122367]|uniref:Cytochrome P450 n=1 Tax=Lentithecium fluviatile CBS 122367 TaxID=1168545 RepID=A0A6G1J518_9PLEO|nr:cytochrome P450 [Lentithecium fluviatile CBS 122367]
MVTASATLSALALAAAIGAVISFVFRTKVDSREPPIFHPKIPFIGHIVGMLKEGPLYLARVSANCNAPIFTLPMLGGRTYICKSPQIAQLVQRASSTLDFDQLIIQVTPRMVGSSKETRQKLLDPTAKEEGRKRISELGHDVIHPPLGVHRISGIVALQLEHFTEFVNKIQDGQENALFKFATREITAASMHTFYGPQNPFSNNPELIEAFWDWEAGIVPYMVDVLPSIFARKAYYGLEKCVQGFSEYLEKGYIKDAYCILRDRQRIHEEAGISVPEQARLEVALSFGFNGNAGITSFWVLQNIFARPDLLSQIRDEIRENALVAPDTISFTKLRDACPLINSVYRETMRLIAPMPSARYVLEDTLLGGEYLLRKDAVVQIGGSIIHHDASIWGPDVEEFNPRRFLYSSSGSKTNADGSVTDKNQVHSAAFRSFGGGASLCPGRHFAQMEIVSLASVMAYGFDMLPPKGQSEVAWNPQRNEKQFPFAAIKPVREVHVKLQRRKGMEDVKWMVKP